MLDPKPPVVLEPNPPEVDPNVDAPVLELLPKPPVDEPKLPVDVEPNVDAPVLGVEDPKPFDVAPVDGVLAPNKLGAVANGAGAVVVDAVAASSGSSFGILFPSLNLNLIFKTTTKYLGWLIIVPVPRQRNCPRTCSY